MVLFTLEMNIHTQFLFYFILEYQVRALIRTLIYSLTSIKNILNFYINIDLRIKKVKKTRAKDYC